MGLSKGLIISLSFSALSCTLLFLYFRNKMTTVERKVNVMFDLVQNYQPGQQYPNQQYESVNEDTENHQDNQNTENTQNTGAWNLNSQDDRIVISDDDSEDEDDDSEEVSDSDSDDDEIPKLSLAKTDNISLTENDIKKISVKETPVIDNTIELEEVDSLDEIEDDDDDDDNSEIETTNQNIKKISVTKNDMEENIDNNEDKQDEDEQDEDEQDEDEQDEVDYTQLKVSELKAIAEAKGLTNYKSLKKTPLIDLIKSSE